MQEAFVQFIWRMQLFTASTLSTTEGETITVIQRGEPNTHSGPDFLHARVRIGDTLWIGNVEIHLKSSGWLAHRHHTDRAYDNVILHVVYEHDMPHSDIPTLELKNIIDPGLLHRYEFMMQTASWIPCEKNLQHVPPIVIRQQLNRMLAERLEEKSLRFMQRLAVNNNDWEETCYQLIARGFGTNVNADPFERVARSLPFKLILKHHDQPIQIEALLFGQAGLLEGNFKSVYPHRLRAEYVFLQKKYNLEPIRALEWKFLRMRPANFPTVRLSQFAAFLSEREKVFSHLLEIRSVKEIAMLFAVEASPYWQEHYHFKKAAKKAPGHIGEDMIHLLVINTFAPLLFLYGKHHDDEQMITHAIDLLEQVPAEKNNITRHWESIGVHATHAGESQGLLHLKREHCDHKRCLDCQVGFHLLNKSKM